MTRIFDHLDVVPRPPEDRRFSRVAWAMRRSPFRTSTPMRDEPVAVSGEIKKQRSMA